jgi:hypothetical protein
MSQQIQEIVTVKEIELSEPQGCVIDSRAEITLQMAGQGGGKTMLIGALTGGIINEFPKVKQFIGANTYLQLSQSTLTAVFRDWESIYGFTQYDMRRNPGGQYVVDKAPPLHFDKLHSFPKYAGIVSFKSGAVILIGSLDNYKAHDGKEFAIAHLDETKDTEEKALTEVIFGRLRQFGLWYDREGKIHFCERVTTEMAKKYGWTFGERLDTFKALALGWSSWTPLYIHTSPAEGGTPWLNDMFNLGKQAKQIKKKVERGAADYFMRDYDGNRVVIYSAYHNEQNLPPGHLQRQEKRLLPDKARRIVHGYPFGKTGGEYFPYFNRSEHVKPTPKLARVLICTTWDFNVIPYMTCLCAQIEFVTRYLDDLDKKHERPGIGYRALEVMVIRVYREYCLEPPRNTTEAVCEDFAADHSPMEHEMDYYGDASGLHRIPGLGSLTNFKIVANKLTAFLHNFSKKVRDPNVLNKHRKDLLNRIFAGKIPTVEIQIDESCEKTIQDLEEVKEGPKGKVKQRVKNEVTGEKEEKYGHPSDALEYLVSEVCKEFIE